MNPSEPSRAVRGPAVPLVLALVAALVAAPGAQAGNLDRFESVLHGPREESLPHPVCGLAGWDTEPAPQGGVSLRFPHFHRCRHLLTASGWVGGPADSRGERLLMEVVFLILGRALTQAPVWLGSGPPANLAVREDHWIPAGCEDELGIHLLWSAEGLNGPGTMRGQRQPARPPDWALCQNRSLELFVAEYSQHPDVGMINRISTVLDSLNLDSDQDLYRLHQIRLLLRIPDAVPTLAEVLAILEGRPLPQPGPTEIGRHFPFRLEADPSQSMILAVQGLVFENYGTTVQVQEAQLGGRALAEAPWPLLVDAGLCMQPVREGQWLMYVSSFQPLVLSAQQPEVSIRQNFLLSTPQAGINVPRYWACFRVADAAGKTRFFHAADATAKGCKGCDQGGRP